MTQTSRERRIYVQKVINDTVSSAVWTAAIISGSGVAATLSDQQDSGSQTKITLSGLTPGCRYDLRALITGGSGQVYEPEVPFVIHCEQ